MVVSATAHTVERMRSEGWDLWARPRLNICSVPFCPQDPRDGLRKERNADTFTALWEVDDMVGRPEGSRSRSAEVDRRAEPSMRAASPLDTSFVLQDFGNVAQSPDDLRPIALRDLRLVREVSPLLLGRGPP
jgi:hypothetical protein